MSTSGPTPPTAEEDGRTAGTTGQRVLVVDDNADSADTLATLLEIMGLEVRTAYDGEQGLAVAEAFRPDALLLDLGMAGMNGFDVCRRVREQDWGERMYILAMTGWGQDDHRRRTQDAGFDGHLVKPIDTAALLKLLSERASGHPARP